MKRHLILCKFTGDYKLENNEQTCYQKYFFAIATCNLYDIYRIGHCLFGGGENLLKFDFVRASM